MKERNKITSWLKQNGNPEIEKYIETNLAITENVRLVIERKGWKTKDLAFAMGKSPSELSKWLSGMHHLTLYISPHINRAVKNKSYFYNCYGKEDKCYIKNQG